MKSNSTDPAQNLSIHIISSSGRESPIPSCCIAFIAIGEHLRKVFQQASFEYPLNLPVWSQPVKAWNPGRALHFSSPNASCAKPTSISLMLSPFPVRNIVSVTQTVVEIQ